MEAPTAVIGGFLTRIRVLLRCSLCARQGRAVLMGHGRSWNRQPPTNPGHDHVGRISTIYVRRWCSGREPFQGDVRSRRMSRKNVLVTAEWAELNLEDVSMTSVEIGCSRRLTARSPARPCSPSPARKRMHQIERGRLGASGSRCASPSPSSESMVCGRPSELVCNCGQTVGVTQPVVVLTESAVQCVRCRCRGVVLV